MINPIKTVTAYETADGQVFDTLEQAQEWHTQIEFLYYYCHGNELRDIGRDIVPAEDVLAWLMDNRAAVLALLNAQRKA